MNALDLPRFYTGHLLLVKFTSTYHFVNTRQHGEFRY